MSIIVCYIDGERKVFDSDNDNIYHNYYEIDGEEFCLFDNTESAGKSAREYWADLAEYDPEEFTCLVGKETLVKWALGQWAGQGSSQVKSLNEWLDLWIDIPEEHFASYDGNERSFKCKHPDFEDITVCYRSN